VRILDSTGHEVRALFAGPVQPGEWIFQWDGLLPDGKPAPPGDYQIDVQSGSRHAAKKVQVKKE
jgi:flagellar hook assembly protein FlgD